MPNSTVSPFPNPIEAAKAGFKRPDDLHFVYVHRQRAFFGYYDACKRYIERTKPESWMISEKDLGLESPIVTFQSARAF